MLTNGTHVRRVHVPPDPVYYGINTRTQTQPIPATCTMYTESDDEHRLLPGNAVNNCFWCQATGSLYYYRQQSTIGQYMCVCVCVCVYVRVCGWSDR